MRDVPGADHSKREEGGMQSEALHRVRIILEQGERSQRKTRAYRNTDTIFQE
ncbi:hypothetical protein NBRC3293_1380 [Gluconobacter oxydans NBRC 3293]|uniref:Uncharacterized protein n=1 Tax=Gluconobacter oxydans NBRC 3293 TaxID=1315969 RepID=A0A829WUT6_GLUOY|nr:hypothetical protein NBRC3293_1380 [Gluconobacter oxydans NBRC 3293]